MSDCCSTSSVSKPSPGKYRCPVNGQNYNQVPLKTVVHHIKEPWHWKSKTQTYYFCDDPECNVVYFGDDNSIITCDHLRTSVGVKDKTDGATICYCFGVSLKDATQDIYIREYVTRQTKDRMCHCEISNPSSKCCLKDFPKS